VDHPSPIKGHVDPRLAVRLLATRQPSPLLIGAAAHFHFFLLAWF